MALSRLDLVLATPDRGVHSVIATLTWPAHLEADARCFIRDNLLAERLGDARRAEAALQRGFVPAADRASFLAERPFYLPEPPAALVREMDLEDLVASFSVALAAMRVADPVLDLVFEFS